MKSARKDEDGSSILLRACRHGHFYTVKARIAVGDNVNACNEKNDRTPLHEALYDYRDKVQKRYFVFAEIVKVLLAAGANVNAKDRFNNTPLYYAVEYGYISTTMKDIVKALIAAGANPREKCNKGKTPLEQAKKRCPRIAPILQDAGSKE